MSLIALTLAGAAGLWHIQKKTQFEMYEAPVDPDPWAAGVLQREKLSTGNYGDISQLVNMISLPGYIVNERFDVDLTGVPCRWLIMRNGGVYKTYDLTTQYIK